MHIKGTWLADSRTNTVYDYLALYDCQASMLKGSRSVAWCQTVKLTDLENYVTYAGFKKGLSRHTQFLRAFVSIK